MHICFDTNVILDMLLQRVPHAETVGLLFAALEEERLHGVSRTSRRIDEQRGFGAKGKTEENPHGQYNGTHDTKGD